MFSVNVQNLRWNIKNIRKLTQMEMFSNQHGQKLIENNVSNIVKCYNIIKILVELFLENSYTHIFRNSEQNIYNEVCD